VPNAMDEWCQIMCAASSSRWARHEPAWPMLEMGDCGVVNLLRAGTSGPL